MGCDRGSWSAPQDSNAVCLLSGSGNGAAAATTPRPLSKWRRSSKLEWGWESARAIASEASPLPCAATKDAEVEKVEKVSIGVDAITIGFSHEDEDPDTCYICLSSEGPMLVNMCACRSLRAHRSCLLELTRRQTGPPVCGVCRQGICPEELELSLPTVEPVALGSQWGKTLRVTSQIVNVIFGLVMLMMGLVGLMAPGALPGIPVGIHVFQLISGLAVFLLSCATAGREHELSGDLSAAQPQAAGPGARA